MFVSLLSKRLSPPSAQASTKYGPGGVEDGTVTFAPPLRAGYHTVNSDWVRRPTR